WHIGLPETSPKSSWSPAAGPSSRRNDRETSPKPGHGKQEMFLTDTEVAGRPQPPRGIPDHGVVVARAWCGRRPRRTRAPPGTPGKPSGLAPLGKETVNPYASWLSSGDNAWQMTAATLVGLMSIPALPVLYGGLVQRKWAVNTILMVFSTFCLVLIAWVLWAFKMGFGSPWIGTFLGKPGTVVGAAAEQAQANIPSLNGLMPKFRFPQGSLVYFQFVFAAITPILFIGSVIGRIKFKAWLIFVPLWITFAYAVNAFLLWGGGWWAAHGALDFSGGYVIHLAAGVSGFVAAAVVGPRLKRDREHGVPNNLLFVAVGAGILWLRWERVNRGGPPLSRVGATPPPCHTPPPPPAVLPPL